MYPGTIFEIVDQSQIAEIPQAEPVLSPLFMAAFTSDKGTEDYGIYSGDDFFKQFGSDIKFAKHGQPLLQAAMAIKAGARLYCKRVVADDATLGNLILTAKVKKVSTQKEDDEGNKIYITASGEETTVEAGNTPVMLDSAEIGYEMSSISGATDINVVSAQAKALYKSADENSGVAVYPIAVFTDNGRGVSKKRIRIVPDYQNSKSVNFTRYSIYVLEGNTEIEALGFTFNPDIVYDGVSTSLKSVISSRSNQIKVDTFDAYIDAFYEAVADAVNYTVDDLKLQDALFGRTKDGAVINGITVSEDTNLQAAYGFLLANGSNGAFGDAPIDSVAYASQMVKVFDGSLTSEIYDLNNLKMYGIVDANYPVEVKNAIQELVDFRQDLLFFRDLGVGLKTLADIIEAASSVPRSMFVATYCNSYDIIDPFSKKQVTVTTGYNIAQLLVNHINNGVDRPFAGIINQIVFPGIIDGTINFIPTITPAGNQKEKLDDARINYIGYYDGLPVMESTYTAYGSFSSLSFVQNVMAVQDIIRAIRSKCPKIRYQFAEAADLRRYQEDVQKVIDNYAAAFATIELEYYADERYEQNNIFYAGLSVKCKKFIQTEYFKVIVL